MNLRELWKEDTILDAGGNQNARRKPAQASMYRDQIHIRLWPDWESNPARIGETHGNNRCANPPAQSSIKIRKEACKSTMGHFNFSDSFHE